MAINVAVIGAGAAGLGAARRLGEDPKFRFQVFEKSEQVGGTWVYEERTGNDEYGVPIHTSMYKSLRTNLPKEVMGYPDFPILQPEEMSYIPAADMLKYLNDYADHFGLRQNIKFRHLVKRVSPKKPTGWTVVVENLLTRKTEALDFDAVMVCNGHYHTPNLPRIEGDTLFKGKKIHSHDYRVPEEFRDLIVVVIGAGPSGLDIALEIAPFTKYVYLSHHWPDPINTVFPDNFSHKPDVATISEDRVHFIDGTSVQVDCILYCTGFVYSFPFLTEECGVRVDNNYVHPLYKHFIVIENQTLALIGLPFYICANYMFDIQTRFFLKTLDGSFELPSKEEMLEDERKEIEKRRAKGFSLRNSHQMGPLQLEYFDDLAETAGIKGVPHVMPKLHVESSNRFLEDLVNFRKDRYKIVDEENFQKI